VKTRLGALVAGGLFAAVVAGDAVAQRRGEYRAAEPAWVEAGKPVTVKLFGQDLAPKEIRFDDPSVTARVVKVEPYAPKTDPEKQRGNVVVEAEVTAPATARPGLYSFQLVPEMGNPVKGQLSLDLPAPEIQESEPNNSLRQPQALPAGSVTVLGKLDNEGVDVYRIDGRAGETWRFEIFARRVKPGNSLEAVIRLRDPRLAPVRAAVDQGQDCFIEHRLPQDGPYVLEVVDGDNRSNGEFTYRLAVRKLPPAGS